MDIKPTNPGNPNWKPAIEPESAKKPAAPAEELGKGPAGPSDAQANFQGPLSAIKSEFKRTDLNTDRWNTILNRSIDALVESTSERMGGLPAPARQKIADLLAADPIFSKRVSLYWDKNLD